jgi:hypothetical protein
MVVTGERELQIEGRLRVIEMTGAWSVYTGERIVIGPGESFRDDLGIKIREMFEEGAAEASAMAARHRSASSYRAFA